MPATRETWNAVDALFAPLVGEDAALTQALARSAAAGLPAIQVAANQGKLLHLLARLVGAQRILEIGTLGGYSAIWLARALPADGRLISLELDPRHAEVARANLAAAGVGDRAEVRVGRAADLLMTLEGPFDLVFIDADKRAIPEYLAQALRLVRPGAVIVVDNVVRGGAVADAATTDPDVLGVRRMAAMVAAEPRLDATVLQTVGAKGYDGLAVMLVR